MAGATWGMVTDTVEHWNLVAGCSDDGYLQQVVVDVG